MFYKTSLLLAALLCSSVSSAMEPFQPLPAEPPIPRDNPQSVAKIALGKQLFFDTRLSITGTHACNHCHTVAGSGSDGRALPVGVYGRKGQRSTLTLWNAAYHTVYNWDGAMPTLEAQFKNHLLDPNVMGMPDGESVKARIAAIGGYQKQFTEIFSDGVSFENIAKAVSSYLRTLSTPNSPFDRFLRGEKTAISAAAKRGYKAFIEVECAACHFWVNLAGPTPGLALQQGEGFYELFPNHEGSDYESRYRLADDQGRYHLTLSAGDRRLWRVPSLRNIALTAPYFHNGAVKRLDEAVRVMAKTQLKKELSEQQVTDIVAFLNTLTGEFPKQDLPRLPGLLNRTAVAGHDE